MPPDTNAMISPSVSRLLNQSVSHSLTQSVSPSVSNSVIQPYGDCGWLFISRDRWMFATPSELLEVSWLCAWCWWVLKYSAINSLRGGHVDVPQSVPSDTNPQSIGPTFLYSAWISTSIQKKEEEERMNKGQVLKVENRGYQWVKNKKNLYKKCCTS